MPSREDLLPDIVDLLPIRLDNHRLLDLIIHPTFNVSKAENSRSEVVQLDSSEGCGEPECYLGVGFSGSNVILSVSATTSVCGTDYLPSSSNSSSP
jgi:hypothetical protein